MYYFFSEVYELIFFVIVTFVVTCLILFFCFLITNKFSYNEKNLGYECGFDPFGEARTPFNVRFYLVSMIFIVFDVEIIFFIPWALSLGETIFLVYYSVYFFVFMLALGFCYEWLKGAINPA